MSAVEVGQRRRWNDDGREFIVLFVGEQNAFIRYDSGSETAYAIDYLAERTTVVTPRPEWADEVVGDERYLWFTMNGSVCGHYTTRPYTQRRWSVKVTIDHDTWEQAT